MADHRRPVPPVVKVAKVKDRAQGKTMPKIMVINLKKANAR